eukprot:scaffold22_cov93-Cylindrotheca_fusiformis.AAC.2
MDVGDTIDFKHISFNVKIQAPFPQKHIVMLAGGTGITPMIQALHAILGNGGGENSDQTVTLFFGNQTSDDILGYDLLHSWEQDYSDRFQVIHVLSSEKEEQDTTTSSSSRHRSGFIDKALLEECAPTIQNDDTLVLVCGPPPMYEALCGPRDDSKLTGALAELGCSPDLVYKF